MDSNNEGDKNTSINKFNKPARLLLFAVLLSTVFRSLEISVIDIGLPTFVTSLAGSLTSFGVIFGIFSITQSIFQYPYAAASDKFGRRKIVLIGMLVYLLGTFLCFIAQDIIQLAVFRAIQGMGAYTSILQALLGDIFRKGEHGKGMGYYSLAMNIGYFGGIVIGAYVSNFLGVRNIFFVSGILTFFMTIFLFITLKERKSEISSQNYTINNNKLVLNLNSLKILFKESRYIITVGLNSVRWFMFGGIVAYLIWVLEIHFGLKEITTSYLLLMILAFYIVFIFYSGRVLDRQGPRKLILIGQAIVILFGLTFFFSELVNNLIFFLIITSLIGIGIALFDPAGNTLLLNVIEEINPELKGSGIGFNNAFGFFISSLAPMIICSLGEIYVFLPFFLIICLVGISEVIVYKYVKK